MFYMRHWGSKLNDAIEIIQQQDFLGQILSIKNTLLKWLAVLLIGASIGNIIQHQKMVR